MNKWPNSDFHSMQKYYGKVGENQTKLRTSYPLKLAWNKSYIVNRITCHEKVAESMDKAMTEILNYYGLKNIKKLELDLWGGCLNVRKVRGGITWSKHAWGVANDWNPEKNRLNQRWEECQFSNAIYIPFFNAWIREGWQPLGLTWGKDAQHIEATNNSLKLIRYSDNRFNYPVKHY